MSRACATSRLVKGLLELAVLALLAPSFAQDACRDVLLRDLGDKQVLQTNQDAQLATQHARCARAASGSQSSSGTNVGATYGGIGANFGQQSSGSNKQQSSDCGSASDNEHFSAALYYAQTVYHDQVDAWKQCVTTQQQLACWAQPQGDPKHLTIHINWSILSAQPSVVSSNLRIGDRNPQTPLASGARLLLGDNLVYVDRATTEDVTLDLQATSDKVSARSCSVWVPHKEAAPPPPAPGDLKTACMQGSATKCSELWKTTQATCGFDAACTGRAQCWMNKSRALTLIHSVCDPDASGHVDTQSCQLQSQNVRGVAERDCDTF
jgi:hypothetical protein